VAGNRENMKRLLAERERLKTEIERLQHELKGLDRAIALMGGVGQVPEFEPVAAKTRGRNVKETVLSIVGASGHAGISAVGVLDKAKELYSVHLDRGSVSSMLSRMKKEGVLDMRDGNYFIAKSFDDLGRKDVFG
jgi:hypothetical protein